MQDAKSKANWQTAQSTVTDAVRSGSSVDIWTSVDDVIETCIIVVIINRRLSFIPQRLHDEFVITCWEHALLYKSNNHADVMLIINHSLVH